MQNPADLFTLNDAILLDEIAALRDVLTRRTLTEPTAERLIALEREAAIRGLSLGALRS